jgi:hypothetical protein
MSKRIPASRVAPCGFKHQLTPLSVGMAAAEFLPADPAIWIEASARAGMQVVPVTGRLLMLWDGVHPDEKNFLLGWLHGTPGGDAAVQVLLSARAQGRSVSHP